MYPDPSFQGQRDQCYWHLEGLLQGSWGSKERSWGVEACRYEFDLGTYFADIF